MTTSNSKDKSVLTKKIDINASRKKVWEILTKPEETNKWIQGAQINTDWKVNNPILWVGKIDEKETTFVKGTILKIEPEQTLTYSTFETFNGLNGIHENYLNVTYNLNDRNEHTVLTITNQILDKAELENIENAWERTLLNIKKIAEE